jgi:hypothetical protein
MKERTQKKKHKTIVVNEFKLVTDRVVISLNIDTVTHCMKPKEMYYQDSNGKIACMML